MRKFWIFVCCLAGVIMADYPAVAKEPSSLDSLREDFEGQELEFLLSVRQGRIADAKRLIGKINYTEGNYEKEEIADAYGYWSELTPSMWKWKRGGSVELYQLDWGAEELFEETYLQATIS